MFRVQQCIRRRPKTPLKESTFGSKADADCSVLKKQRNLPYKIGNKAGGRRIEISNKSDG